jgi:hypothetical protein
VGAIFHHGTDVTISFIRATCATPAHRPEGGHHKAEMLNAIITTALGIGVRSRSSGPTRAADQGSAIAHHPHWADPQSA